MTTATRSRIRYIVRCDRFYIGEGDDREDAETVRDGHATRNNNDPLSNRYTITPVLRKEKD